MINLDPFHAGRDAPHAYEDPWCRSNEPPAGGFGPAIWFLLGFVTASALAIIVTLATLP
jgi:hypothetical protein